MLAGSWTNAGLIQRCWLLQARTRAMGFLGDTYYDTQTLTAITATESEDEAIVYADQVNHRRSILVIQLVFEA